MKVYTVIREYHSCCSSNYSLMGVYQSRQLAENYVKRAESSDGGDYEIEEHDIIEVVDKSI